MRNYYKVMGLKFEATDDEIKRTYRELAKQCHPDMHPDDKDAAARFAEISEAYETLGDSARRAEYDRQVQEMMAARRAAAQQQQQQQQRQQQQQQRQQQQRTMPPNFSQAFHQNFNQAQANAFRMAADAQTAGYNRGYSQGFNDAKTQAEQTFAALKRENAQLKKRVEEAEQREKLAAEQRKADEKAAEIRTADLVKPSQGKESEKQMRHRIEKMTEELTAMTGRIDRATAERRYYEEQYATAKAELAAVTEELEITRQQLATWEEYGKTLDAADDIEKTEVEWERLKRGYKKRSKPTHYGTLGVMFYASIEEIKDAYHKLVDRYKKRADTDKKAAEKLFAVNDAFKVLSDAQQKEAYDAEQGFTQEECAQAIETQAKYEQQLQTLYAEKEEQEFKAYLEDLMYSAQVGDAEAQNTLGEMYYYGDEIEKDWEQAVYWFKEAAKQRHPEAMFNLGRCFIGGEGVEADAARGNGFVKQAAALGSKAAQDYIEGKK